MAKNKKIKAPSIRINCAYCKHGGAEAEIGHMFPCLFLEYCVVANRGACKAKELGKGDFEIDTKKLNEWNLKNK